MAKKVNISALRKRLKLSQTAFAERLGVNQATVSRLESGRPPSKPVLKLLEMMTQ